MARDEALRRGLRYAIPFLWVLLLDAWFQGPLLGSAGLAVTSLLALALAGAITLYLVKGPRPVWTPAFAGLVAGILALATLVRLPALTAPAGLISSDSAVAGIIAQELRAGQLPAPIYAPGFPYEGTLKPHVTALLGLLLPWVETPTLYAWTSHAFYLLWTACVMALARGVAGNAGAGAAGLYMAISPRFLTAFSLNNVGQYPEVNALGALALALLSMAPGLLACGFVLGLALWQQLLGVYFILAAALAIAVTPALRRPRLLAEVILGFVAGSYPLWIWNLSQGGETFDWFRRGSKNPADRLLGLPDRLDKTLTVSFPKLFGLTDLEAPALVAVVLGMALPILVLVMALRYRSEIRERRGRHPAFLAALLLVVVVSVFAGSKFSHRGAQRPRYLIPVYTATTVAFGWGVTALGRHSRALGALAAAAALGLNAGGLWPWLHARAAAEARDRAVVTALDELGVRTGYSGFWVAGKYTFLAGGRTVLSGELGPAVSWVHPSHMTRVREAGPDAYIVPSGPLADALAARLNALGCAFQRKDVGGLAVFHHLGRRVSLEEVEGYDLSASEAELDEEPD